MNIGTLTLEMAANVARLRQDMDAARRTVDSAMGGIRQSAQTAMNALGGLAAGLSVGAFVGKLVQVQREFDVLNSSLKTVTGSSAAAAREMEWIKSFAKETPFGLAQATQAFVKMKSLGLDPSRAALTSYGNTASAMGKDLNQMIEAVADASTGEFERLKEFGIKASKQGDQVSFTFQGVTETIGNNAAEINRYLESIGNNQFAGAMAERANTLDGAIASLGDTWDELFRTISAQNAGTLMHDAVRLAEGAVTDLTTVIGALNSATGDNAKQTGAMAAVQEGLAVAFETVAVLGANVKYVLVQVGNELGGLAAQAMAVATGQFTQAAAIGRMMKTDAEAARAEVDATSARILNARKVAALSLPNNYDEPAIVRARAAAEAAAAATKAAAAKSAADAATAAATAKAAAAAKAVAAEKALAEQQKRHAEVVKLRNKLVEQGFEAQQKLQEAARAAYATDLAQYNRSANSAQQRLQDLTDQAEAVAYAEQHQVSLARAVEITTIARLKDQQVAAMGNEAAVMALQAEIEARQKIIGVLGSTETRDAARELRKNEEAEWAKTWDQVGQSFTDALMECGKSVSKYLKGLFRTLVLRPILTPIGAGMASLFGAPAAAGQGGAGAGSMDMLSSVGSLYNAVSNGVSSSVTAGFTKLMSSDFGQKIGMSYYDGNAYQLTGTGQSVGNAMGMAGNAMAGYGLQKAISGGYEVGNGNLVDAVTIAASAYFGPLAGVAAGVFNRAFGRKLKDMGIEGSFGGEEGFAGQQYQFLKGGWLRSDKTKYSDMDAGMQTALGDQFKALQMQTGLMATALGQGTDAIAAFTQDIKISFKGLSEEQIAQKLQEQFAGVADNLANLVLGETDLAKAGETAAQTLGRLASSLTTVNAISDTLGWALQGVSLAGGAAASNFADLFGGLDKMAAATSSYYDAFYTESERTATATRQLTTQLAALGVVLPASRDAYRDLIDNALASGNQQLAADLIMLSGAFAALSQSTDDLAAQATQAAQELASAGEDLRSALSGLLQPLLDAVASARAQASGAMATVAGLPGPTLQQLRDQVAAQQVTLPSAAGVLGAQATADAAYLRLADTSTAASVYQRQADSANAALQAAVAQSAAAATAFGNTKTSIVAAEAAENAAFAKLGYAYGGGFTVDAQGKPVWSNTEMNGQSRWAKSLGGGWNASLGAYEGPAALAAMRGGTAGQWNDYWSSMGTSGAPTQDPNAPWNRLDALSKQYGTDLTALTKAQAAQTTAAAAQAAASAKLTGATTARAQAQAAVDAATAAQAKAQADYAAALRGYVADASKAVDKLSDLREQTVAYYEAQKQLADGMTASAQRLREAAQAMRFGQLSAAQSLAQQRQQFDRQYTLALSTGGMVQAGYADQLASSLPALSESIKATSTSRADWATATARLFAQSQTVAAALEANAPKDYQTESLAVLAQIDGTLAAIEAATSSAEKIISDAIFESGDNTLAGLRAVIAAIKGETIPAFAKGGAFTSGIVSRPTAFNMGLMGEAGPEAIMPLANIGGSLGVRVTSGRDDGALIAEMQALRAEVQALRAEARATAINTGRTQDLMKRVTRNGEAMQTEAST